MVGFGAARLVSAQLWILESWRCSSVAKAESKNLAWRCQDGSLVSGASGEPSDGGRPARKRAVSSTLAVSAAFAASAEAKIKPAATAANFIERCISWRP